MIDPLNLNIATAGVETTVPLLPEADYEVEVKESTIDPNKDENGLNWNLKLGLVNPTVALDGREVNPDFPVYHLCALQARSDSKDPEAFKRSIAETIDAVFGTTKENRPALTHELVQQAVGKRCIAKLFIDEWKGDKRNKVKRLKAVGVEG